MESDHAGAGLLKAIAQRLCQDIDEADRIPERIAATRAVLQLLQVLDGALFGGGQPTGGDLPTSDDGDPEPEGTAHDDPFKIGDMPPGLGDEAS